MDDIFGSAVPSLNLKRLTLGLLFRLAWGKEISGPTEASLGERNRVLFAEVFHYVTGGVFVLRQRLDVDYVRSGEMAPSSAQFLLCQIVATDEQMEVWKTGFVCFEASEVFELGTFSSVLFSELGDFPAGVVENLAGCAIGFAGAGQRDEPVGFCGFDVRLQFASFRDAAVRARPGFAEYADHVLETIVLVPKRDCGLSRTVDFAFSAILYKRIK